MINWDQIMADEVIHACNYLCSSVGSSHLWRYYGALLSHSVSILWSILVTAVLSHSVQFRLMS